MAGGRRSVGILLFDSIDQPHRAVAGDYPDLFTSLLANVDVDVEFFDGRADSLPSATACDGWLLPGSRTSVYGSEPWLPAVRSWTSSVLDVGQPLVGVCFGHQLIAQVMGAPVAPADVGWNIGAVGYEVAGDVPGLETDTFHLLASHKDQVSELPEGATLTARSPRCPIAAFTVGDHVRCVQAHPEFVPSLAASLYGSRRERIGDDVVDAALATLETPLDRQLVADWLLAPITELH